MFLHSVISKVHRWIPDPETKTKILIISSVNTIVSLFTSHTRLTGTCNENYNHCKKNNTNTVWKFTNWLLANVWLGMPFLCPLIFDKIKIITVSCSNLKYWSLVRTRNPAIAEITMSVTIARNQHHNSNLYKKIGL